jgi:hypothetical protein
VWKSKVIVLLPEVTKMRNITVSINVSLRETKDPATESDVVERMDDGSFRVILLL